MACGTAQLKQTTQTSYMFSDYREGGGWGKHHFMLWRTRDTNQKQTKTKQKSRDDHRDAHDNFPARAKVFRHEDPDRRESRVKYDN